MVTFEQYKAARAECAAVNSIYAAFSGDEHPDHADLQARYAAASAIMQAWWDQPDPLVDAHNARMIAMGDAE